MLLNTSSGGLDVFVVRMAFTGSEVEMVDDVDVILRHLSALDFSNVALPQRRIA